jgi:hypothetical protein
MKRLSWRRISISGGRADLPLGGREERLTHNETTARQINEGVEGSNAPAAASDTIRIMCECGQLECLQVLAITIAEYEGVRRDPRTFAVSKDHVMPEIEDIVEKTDRFVVVRKREGFPAQIAEEENPGSGNP